MATERAGAKTPWMHQAANWVYFGFGVVSLILALAEVGYSNAPLAGICFTAGILLILASTIERFESIKGLGVEARTKQLDQKIQQADEVLDKLRRMYEVAGPALVQIADRVGTRNGRLSASTLVGLVRDVQRLMAEMGTSGETIRDAIEPLATTLCSHISFKYRNDLSLAIADEAQRIVNEIKTLEGKTENPNLIKNLTAKRDELFDFLNRGVAYQSYQLSEYPAIFDEMFEIVPDPIDAAHLMTIRRIREQAAMISADMRGFNRGEAMNSPELWARELETQLASPHIGDF